MTNPTPAMFATLAFDQPPKSERRGTISIPLLSHLRWASALIVVLSHIQQNLLSRGSLTAIPTRADAGLVTKQVLFHQGYGHAAVVIFFVLSGFLVGGKLIGLASSQTLRHEWPHFLVDRFTRIFIVAWPALVLTLIVLLSLMWLLPNAPFVRDGNWAIDLVSPLTYDATPLRWLAGFTLLNEILAPTLQTDGPLWSLSYEWSYYIVGLATVLGCRRIMSPGAVVVIFYGSALVVLCLVNQPDIIFSALCWIAGVVARWIFNRGYLRSTFTQVAGIVSVVSVLAIQPYVPTPDPVLSAALMFTIAHTGWTRWTFCSKLGDKLAAFSFSLYAMHFPVLLAIMGGMLAFGWLPSRLPFNFLGFTAAGFAMLVIVAAARAFAYVTEDKTAQVRRAILFHVGLSTT